MTGLQLWMRVVGGFYVFLFVACAVLRLPIRAEGPKGVLDQASAGDPTARFVVDTWIWVGLLLLVIGSSLLIGSRYPAQARILVWTQIGFEIAGIVMDVYKITRGYDRKPMIVWILIHSAIIATALVVVGSPAIPTPLGP